MTFRELVQRLRRETGYAGSGPTTVVSQSGYHQRAVDWIIDAYVEIQNRHLWRWMRKEFSLNTSDGTATYAPGDCTDTPTGLAISRFRTWRVNDHRNPATCYLQSSGEGSEYYLTFMPWEHFRTVYQIGTQATGAPAHITVDPDDNIVLGPTPNDTYVVKGEYHRSAQILDDTDDDDVPEMPSDYHMLIVFRAMEDFGYFEVSQEAIQRSQRKGRRMMRQLEGNQLPKMRMAGPLA